MNDVIQRKDNIIKIFSSKIANKIRSYIFKDNCNDTGCSLKVFKKEIFLDKFRMKLKHVNFIMGVGGSFDVISGDIIRAPLFMQKIGFEWFYRFLQEPKRMWKRYLFGNINFIYLVIKKKFSNSTIILFLVL